MRESTEEQITSNLNNLNLIKFVILKSTKKWHKMTSLRMNVTISMMKDDWLIENLEGQSKTVSTTWMIVVL